jgi:hypothetical protein
MRSDLEVALLSHYKTMQDFEADLTASEEKAIVSVLEALLPPDVRPPEKPEPSQVDDVERSPPKLTQRHGLLDVDSAGAATRRSLAFIAIAAAVGGAGAAVGRDVYRHVKRHPGDLIFLAIVASIPYLAYIHARGMRGARYEVAALLGACFWGCLIVLWLIGSQGSPPAVRAMFYFAIAVVVVVTALATAIAYVRGKRAGRKDRFVGMIRAENEQFLEDNGIVDVGGREATYVDAGDNELTLHDRRRDALVFRIRGRRGGRAYIDLDEVGRMVRYRIE